MSHPLSHLFHQLDVFGAAPLQGNPLAVVHAAEGLTDEQMALFARWTQLSETTFLLPPTDPTADYRVRIFTPHEELPFAGHPTLGSCRAWLAAGGVPREQTEVVQQCGVGLVRVRLASGRPDDLAFAAPPLMRSGALDADLLQRLCAAIGVPSEAVLLHQWVDNGPGWCALMLADAAQVRAVQVDWELLRDNKLGLVGAHAQGSDAQFELRALIGKGRFEDPVTGSLQASVAQWLIGAGLAPEAYVATQGHALRRSGRVNLAREGGQVWVGGAARICIAGQVRL